MSNPIYTSGEVRKLAAQAEMHADGADCLDHADLRLMKEMLSHHAEMMDAIRAVPNNLDISCGNSFWSAESLERFKDRLRSIIR